MSVSYENINTFLINTLKIPRNAVDSFLKYNKIIFRRYRT
jgi:hypothetical protein